MLIVKVLLMLLFRRIVLLLPDNIIAWKWLSGFNSWIIMNLSDRERHKLLVWSVKNERIIG